MFVFKSVSAVSNFYGEHTNCEAPALLMIHTVVQLLEFRQ